MYGIKLEKYVPAPKPATADRIVAVHYYPAWKKESAGLHNGFSQELDSATEEYVPDFDLEEVKRIIYK